MSDERVDGVVTTVIGSDIDVIGGFALGSAGEVYIPAATMKALRLTKGIKVSFETSPARNGGKRLVAIKVQRVEEVSDGA